MLEKGKTGLNVSTSYGTRNTGSITGFDTNSSGHRSFVWVYDPDYLLGNRNVLPKGANVLYANMSGAGSVTVGGVAIASATPKAPVAAHGEVVWAGAVKGDVLEITYTHWAAQKGDLFAKSDDADRSGDED